jgi:hypothetical protein
MQNDRPSVPLDVLLAILAPAAGFRRRAASLLDRSLVERGGFDLLDRRGASSAARQMPNRNVGRLSAYAGRPALPQIEASAVSLLLTLCVVNCIWVALAALAHYGASRSLT